MEELYYVCLVLILIDSILGITAWAIKRLDVKLLPVVFAVTISIIDEIVAYYFRIKFQNNLVVYFLGSTLEFCCFAWFLRVNIDYPIVKKLIRYCIVAFLIFVLSYLYFFLKLDALIAGNLLNYLRTFHNVLLTAFCICYFKNIFDHIGAYKPLNFYILIIVSGMLFYYSFNAIYDLVNNYLINTEIKKLFTKNADPLTIKTAAGKKAYEQLMAVRPLLYITSILLYLCIFVALLKSAIIVKKYKISAG